MRLTAFAQMHSGRLQRPHRVEVLGCTHERRDNQLRDPMKRWDVELLTGNFKSEEAAREMAEYLREMMEERLGSQEVRKH